MTVGEFKAFIEGMGIKDKPTAEQWKRIMAKAQQLGEAPVVCPVPIVIPEPCRPLWPDNTWRSGSSADPMPEQHKIWCAAEYPSNYV